MMNIHNPSFPQHSYGYSPTGNPMAQPPSMPQFPGDFPQNQFQQQQSQPFPGNIQRPIQYPQQQPQGQIPPHVYQQLQQQQQQAAFARPQSRGNATLGQGQSQRQPSINPNLPTSGVSTPVTPTSAPTSQSIPGTVQQNMAQSMGIPQAQGQNNAQIQRTAPAVQQPQTPLSPQAIAREEERVSTLLQINSHLIQEVASLQAQGKAGSNPGQQSPTSPIAGAENSAANSNPSEPPKRQQPSQEYAECMRRLQANLAYLAAIADANKKAGSARPVGPAIMIPPPHMVDSMGELYKKLKMLFPEASQSKINKAMAFANAQAQGGAAPMQPQANNQG